MQGKHLYEYAVIRLVPKVEREEFFNVGVILFSKKANFIRSLCHIDENKLRLYASELNPEVVSDHLQAFQKVCSGSKDGGPIASLEMSERFWWLTAVRSSCIQTSRPHAGFSEDLDKTIERLFEELVL